MKIVYPLLLICTVCMWLFSQSASLAQQLSGVPSQADRYPDTWVATDALGRQTPLSSVVKMPQHNRFVGIFYFLTHGSDDYYYAKPGQQLDYSTYGSNPLVIRDNSVIIQKVKGDPVSKPNAWPPGEYWWGEPAVGYFLADDDWVARKDLMMLSDAGVNTLIFDVTNGPIYWKALNTVLGTAEKMRSEGLSTPQFCFITFNSTGTVTQQLYDRLYSKGQYKNLWFLWDGKPLIFGSADGHSDLFNPGSGPPLAAATSQFFTWRHSWANTKGPNNNGKDEWEWSDSGDPQLFGWHRSASVPEEVPVLVGGWSSSDIGRSFTGGDQPWGIRGVEPPLDQSDLATDVAKGLFFSQQWCNAIKIDPEFVWVTGWNEWTATRQYGPGVPMVGKVTKPGEYYFVDEYNEEFSRDIMPMSGGFGDNYYMQLVDGIRQYKGVRPVPMASGFRTMKLNGSFAQWKKVQPVYIGTRGYTNHRDHYGWGSVKYTDRSGRNEIVECRATCDSRNIYFYACTARPITKWSDPSWMNLLIDTGSDRSHSWNGYNFVINAKVLNGSTTTIKRFSDGRIWTIHYRVSNNELEVVVPRTIIGLNDLKRTQFDFHWCDNVQVGGTADIVQWWYTGDSAPDGRFNYRYINNRN